MIIVPEIETVVILVPRTGTKSLRLALLEKYPGAMQIYRHMEADGVPAGYDRWRRVGVLRHPLDRLWSLYRYLRVIGSAAGGDDLVPDGKGKWEPSYVGKQRRSVAMPFSRWIVENETVFTAPYDSAGDRFFPGFTVRHALPETRKSQFVYLRPDLGTEIYTFGALERLALRLGVKLGHHHRNPEAAPPPLTPQAADHMTRFFAWDYSALDSANLRQILSLQALDTDNLVLGGKPL